ncbi:GHKL domain-containing protein [Paenibacillus sp. AK121]|uniref:sensor histidine kinase n=2 Tax=Paenibacillus TaxID=44249 RepID=UPI000ABCE772|nr:GHKL domain-containing protein [Paenibacillus sp. AK121]
MITSGIYFLQYTSYLVIYHMVSGNGLSVFRMNYKLLLFLVMYYFIGITALNNFGLIVYLFLFVLLAVYGWLTDKYESLWVIGFYAILTIFITTLLGYFITVISYAVPYEYKNKWTAPFLTACSPPLIYLALRKLVSYLFPTPAVRLLKIYRIKLIVGASLILVLGIIGLGLIIYSECESNNPYPSRLKIVLMLIGLTSIFLMTINWLYRFLRERELEKNKTEQYLQLEAYIMEIEKMYEDIRGFRHDYTNILLMLDEGIRTGDLAMIKRIYESSIQPTASQLNGYSYSLDNLINLDVSELKSIITSKVLVAKKRGVDVKLEIDSGISEMYMDIIDLCRVISCFLDNAIDAALETCNPSINIVLIHEDDIQTVTIRNSYNHSALDGIKVNDLYKRNFSTKADNRGLGLYNIAKVLRSNKYVTLDTKKEPDFFTQTLIIKRATS